MNTREQTSDSIGSASTRYYLQKHGHHAKRNLSTSPKHKAIEKMHKAISAHKESFKTGGYKNASDVIKGKSWLNMHKAIKATRGK